MITFAQATSAQKKIVVAIAGQSGAGKTFSALEIGTGLVNEPARELFMVDTEFGRGAHYANSYAFQYGQLAPPFTPERYREAIEASIAAGSQCTIIDSLSHMWEGENGILDWHGDIALKMARGDEARAEIYNFPAWREPKQALQKFILYLQRCPIHLILCFRAKEKSKMVKTVGHDGRTRTEIVTVGLQPIIDTATPYEATFLAMLSPEEPGVPHWTHKALAEYLQPIFENGKHLSRQHGRRLAQWCGDHGEATGGPATTHWPPMGVPLSAMLSKRRAGEIMDALRASPDLQDLGELWDSLHPEIEAASIEGYRAIENVYTYRMNTLTAEQSSKAVSERHEHPMSDLDHLDTLGGRTTGGYGRGESGAIGYDTTVGLPSRIATEPPGQATVTESAQDSGDTSSPAGRPSTAEQTPPKRRGRPPGSKNRPKEPPLSNEDLASASDAAIAAGQPAEDSNENDDILSDEEIDRRRRLIEAGEIDTDETDDDDSGPAGPLYGLQDPGTGADLGPFPPDEFIRMVKVLVEEPMTNEELLRLKAMAAGPLKEIAASIPGLRDAAAAVSAIMTQRYDAVK